MTEIYRLARYDVFRLFGMTVIVWIVEQIISFQVEKIVWGAAFVHWFDVAFTVVLFAGFGFVSFHMARRITALFNGIPDSD